METAGPREKPLPTVQDIARDAGVSVATVSRVLNASPNVAERTRRRVQAVIQTLGYTPNNLARNLRARALRVFGLVISDIRNPFFTSLERGVEDAARAAGFSLLLANTDDQPKREAECLRMLLHERVAGVILVPTGGTQVGPVNALLRQGIPVVALDRPLAGVDIDTVQTDNTRGTWLAVEHLYAHGHREMAILNGPLAVGSAAQRAYAFSDGLRRLGLDERPQWSMQADFREKGGYEATMALLSVTPRPTALLVANNLMALGAIRAAADLRVRVPDDLAVIGFDDIPWAPVIAPPLTTVAHPTYELGRIAAELLGRRLTEPSRPAVTVLLPPRLVVRASCGVHLPETQVGAITAE